MRVSYEELLSGRESLTALLCLPFDQSVALKLAKLGREAALHFSDYDKVRAKLEDHHAARDENGDMVPMVHIRSGENGEEVAEDIPGTFQITNQEEWERDSKHLLAATVSFNGELRMTEKDLEAIRSRGDFDLEPQTISGLGPFFAWMENEPIAAESAADEIWESLQAK